MKSHLMTWIYCLGQYGKMSLFVSTPARLPQNRVCIIFTLLAYFAVGLFFLGEIRGVTSITLQILIEVLIFFSISVIALKFVRKPERLLQTFSALIGVSLVISLVSLTVISLIPPDSDPQQLNPLVLQTGLLLQLWNLAVISLIFKRALEIRTIIASFIALNYFIFYEFLIINFF